MSTIGLGWISSINRAAGELADHFNAAVQSAQQSVARSRAGNEFPQDLGEDAFIRIDESSAGGKHWPFVNILKFAFINESGFTESTSANYSEKQVLGRSESFQAYEGTESRTIPITLRFYAMGVFDNVEQSIEIEVRRKVDFCRALIYPTYVGRRMYPPPAVFFSFGKMFTRRGLPLRGLIKNVDFSYDGPFSTATLAPHTAEVSMEFVCANQGNEIPSTQRIADGRF